MAELKVKDFPTMEEFTRKVAECALDEYRYIGKTIREWANLISAADADGVRGVEDVLMDLETEAETTCPFCGLTDSECESCKVQAVVTSASDLIEQLYADNCAIRAEMGLLTKDRDEWKNWAKAAEQALNDLKAGIFSPTASRECYGMTDEETTYKEFLKEDIARDIMRQMQEKGAIRYTVQREDAWTSEMRGTISVLLEPLQDQEEKEC